MEAGTKSPPKALRMTIFSVVLFLYSLALVFVLLIGLPWWLARMATAAKYREGLAQRLGRIPKHLQVKQVRPIAARPRLGSSPKSTHAAHNEPEHFETIWVHAVSVGEVAAVTELVIRLAMKGYRIVVSTTTRTGQRMARERFGEKSVFYFPLDLRRIVRRYLAVLKPRMLVLVETELWPNVLTECRHASIPVAIVNARISDRSYPRYMRLRRLWRPLLHGLSLVLAQSELDVDRLKAIGVPPERLRLGGNLKFDVRPAEEAPLTAALRENLPPGMRLLVCGSTTHGEEAALLAAWEAIIREAGPAKPALCMILAPRHPERFPAVAHLLEETDFTWERRTEWMRAPEPLRPGSIFLLNSIGELASVYSIASVAFVGGSLVPLGGHNPLEPAQFGVPVVMGRYFHNFRTIVKRLLADQAIRIVGGHAPNGSVRSRGPRSNAEIAMSLVPELTSALSELLNDLEQATAMGSRARAVFRSESGASERAVDALLSILAAPPGHDSSHLGSRSEILPSQVQV